MGKYKSIFLESFVGTSGALGALAVSLLIGMAFGIPGLILVAREQKKAKGDQNMALLVFGFILMILGVALGLGFNAGGLVNSIKNEF